MIDQSLDVTRIELTRDDREGAFAPPTNARGGGVEQSMIRHQSKWPIFTFLVSRYFALCGFASLRIGTCSTI